MTGMRVHRKRRKRRTARQVLAHGPTAKRPHTHVAGRTGKIHERKTPPKDAAGFEPASWTSHYRCVLCGALLSLPTDPCDCEAG